MHVEHRGHEYQSLNVYQTEFLSNQFLSLLESDPHFLIEK